MGGIDGMKDPALKPFESFTDFHGAIRNAFF